MRAFPARSPRIRHLSKLTESDWENAVRGLGKVPMTTMAHNDYLPMMMTMVLKMNTVLTIITVSTISKDSMMTTVPTICMMNKVPTMKTILTDDCCSL